VCKVSRRDLTLRARLGIQDLQVSRISLWIACVVHAKLSSLLSVQETASSGRSKGVCSRWRSEISSYRVVGALLLLLRLVVAVWCALILVWISCSGEGGSVALVAGAEGNWLY
jgi:hypothetical protein